MAILNYEFKARTAIPGELEKRLLTLEPRFAGEDRQCDTYFNVSRGRLKLREGNIENSLIWYERENIAGAKTSEVLLYHHNPGGQLKEILSKVHGVRAVVDKKRKIYFVGNVKFHFDTVAGLGNFIEVEAIDKDGSLGIEQLKVQAEHYAKFFCIGAGDYVAESYADMVINR